MTTASEELLAELRALGDEKVRAQYQKNGAGDNVLGVRLGDLRKVAARFKSNPGLARELWATGVMDARLLAILLLKPKDLSREELDRMVRDADVPQLADWMNANLVKEHPDRESWRESWMDDSDPWAARAGWALTSGRVARKPEGLDLPALLGRIEREMAGAPSPVQWTMNSCLANIGIHFAEHRKRALAIGERLGVYRDYPVSKGCTSPFAPIWINELVRRQG